MKRLFTLFITLFTLSVAMTEAGELEKILAKNSATVIYLYSPTCSYCQKFDPNYTKLSDKYGKNYQFVKMNITSKSSYSLISELGVRYVPYVLLFNSKKHTVVPIDPECMLSYSCSESAIKKQFN